MDNSLPPVQGPVHSLWTTVGDCGSLALSTSGFAVNTMWRRKTWPRTGDSAGTESRANPKKLPSVTKPSPQGVAVRPPKRHAFVVDQREWDYGARLPRDRRAEESWSLDSGPESTDLASGTPKWQSITDTGSLEPSAEALAWAQRADQWAQQPNLPERSSTHDGGTVSRWSEVVPTGTTPAGRGRMAYGNRGMARDQRALAADDRMALQLGYTRLALDDGSVADGRGRRGRLPAARGATDRRPARHLQYVLRLVFAGKFGHGSGFVGGFGRELSAVGR